MTDTDILNEILENTKTTKNTILNEQAIKEQGKKEYKAKLALEEQEKADKLAKQEAKKEASKKASAKFTKVGADFNVEDMIKVSSRLETLDINKSAYIKRLVFADLGSENDLSVDLPSETVSDSLKANYEALEEEKLTLQKALKLKNEEIIKLEGNLQRCQNFKNEEIEKRKKLELEKTQEQEKIKRINNLSLFDKIKYIFTK